MKKCSPSNMEILECMNLEILEFLVEGFICLCVYFVVMVLQMECN